MVAGLAQIPLRTRRPHNSIGSQADVEDRKQARRERVGSRPRRLPTLSASRSKGHLPGGGIRRLSCKPCGGQPLTGRAAIACVDARRISRTCRIRVRYGGTPRSTSLPPTAVMILRRPHRRGHVLSLGADDVVFATHVEWFPPLQSLPLHQEAPLIPSETVRSLRGGQSRKFRCRAWRHTLPSSDTAPSLRLAMFRFQQATGPIDQVSQLALEPEHSALPFADFA